MIRRYDSIAALRREAITVCGDFKRGWHHEREWYGNETLEETLYKTEIGDTKLVPAAEKSHDEFQHNNRELQSVLFSPELPVHIPAFQTPFAVFRLPCGALNTKKMSTRRLQF